MKTLRKFQTMIILEILFWKITIELFTLISTENTILKNFYRRKFPMKSFKQTHVAYQLLLQMKTLQGDPVCRIQGCTQ